MKFNPSKIQLNKLKRLYKIYRELSIALITPALLIIIISKLIVIDQKLGFIWEGLGNAFYALFEKVDGLSGAVGWLISLFPQDPL